MLTLLAVNTLLIGLLAFSFAQGPYSSHRQEVWYRYGSLGFLLGGVALPTIALLFGAARSRRAVTLLIRWMTAAFLTCFAYACLSTGGV